jgi:SPP1 family predicted phage head-tail adaptor
MTRTPNGRGGWVESWTTEASVFGSIRPATGREITLGSSMKYLMTHRIELPWIAGLTTKKRLTLGARVFNIRALVNEDERNWKWLVDAEEKEQG